MTMQNRFPGTCKCGTYVAANCGSVSKVRGKWIVRCCNCDDAVQPQREMLGQVDWPNGMGCTECTTEYEDAYHAMLDAKGDYEAAGGEDGTDPAAYEAYHRACDAVASLQAAGGHLGRHITYDKPDVLGALMGGGKIAVSPDGWKIA